MNAMSYDLHSMNCQTIAASFAVMFCDDGFAAWDSLEHMSFFGNGSGP